MKQKLFSGMDGSIDLVLLKDLCLNDSQLPHCKVWRIDVLRKEERCLIQAVNLRKAATS